MVDMSRGVILHGPSVSVGIRGVSACGAVNVQMMEQMGGQGVQSARKGIRPLMPRAGERIQESDVEVKKQKWESRKSRRTAMPNSASEGA
jgi:hypothetical protein